MKKEKSPVMIKAGKKAWETRRKNELVKKQEIFKAHIATFSPVKRKIAESLLSGKSPEAIIKSMSKGRKKMSNAKAYVTMTINDMQFMQNDEPLKVISPSKRMKKKAKNSNKETINALPENASLIAALNVIAHHLGRKLV